MWPMEPAHTGNPAGVPERPDPGSGPRDAIAVTVERTRPPVSDLGTDLDPGLDLEAAIALGGALLDNLGHVLLGSPEALEAAAIAALAGGHLLIEDVPGVGKTMLARALAVSLGAELSRVQGHPDLLPSDITGVSVYSPDTVTWEFRPGPVFAHVVLVDELNRTPPRTQSALLETMEEQQVSVDGAAWPLPRPHLVIATQNPRSQRGTFPLVESQLDRFAIATTLGYPDAASEAQLALQHGGKQALTDLTPVCTIAQWLQAQQAIEAITVTPALATYAVDLCRASRVTPGVRLGASPRAAIWLIRAAQAHAALSARPYVVPDDVKAVARRCLAHRILLDDGDESIEQAGSIVDSILEATATPRP
jgi:MoxR-like ATPase